MHFAAAAFNAVALLAVATVQARTAAIQARSAAVEFCTNNNLQGNCVNIFPANGQCVTFGSDFNDQVSSVHVQSGTTCTLFVNNGCKGRNLFIGSDVAELGDFNFNDITSSFHCNA